MGWFPWQLACLRYVVPGIRIPPMSTHTPRSWEASAAWMGRNMSPILVRGATAGGKLASSLPDQPTRGAAYCCVTLSPDHTCYPERENMSMQEEKKPQLEGIALPPGGGKAIHVLG